MGPLANIFVWILFSVAQQSARDAAQQIGYLCLQNETLQMSVDPQTVAWDHARNSEFYPPPPLPDLNPPPTMFNVFIHGRRAGKDRPTRIVSVQGGQPKRYAQYLLCRAWRLASMKSGSSLRETAAGASSFPVIVDRLYAGQPDPVDESHFTIHYETAGKSGTIDGWLMPDDTIVLGPRPK